MSLVLQLLHAIVAVNGDAVVLHTGDTPYVAGAGTETEIAAGKLTFQAVDEVLKQLLPESSQKAFDSFGSIRYECPPFDAYPGERFVVVALRETDELWLEIRREGVSVQPPAAGTVSTGVPAAPLTEPMFRDDLTVPDFEALWPGETREQTLDSGSFRDLDALDGDHASPQRADNHASPPRAENRPQAAGRMWSDLDESDLDQLDEGLPVAGPSGGTSPPRRDSTSTQPLAPPRGEHRPAASGQALDDLSEFELDKLDDPQPPPRLPSPVPHEASPSDERTISTGNASSRAETPASAGPPAKAVPPRQAVVLSMPRSQIRNDAREPMDLKAGGLVRLLRIVAARGGSALYITSGAQPSMRVDGEMRALDGEEPLGAADTEALLLGVMPQPHEALGRGERMEWISDVTDLGRVRCVSFHDRRGTGGIFRILTARPASVERLGLSRQVQALVLEPEGLVLVAGPRSSGKSTLIATFVDLINRTRRDHVITIESEIQVVHESHGSMISQREVRGDPEDVLAAVRSALREDPDVLVIDEFRDDATTHLALEAAGSGRLVIASLPAHTTSDALVRFIDHFPHERQPHARVALAENLRGIIAQSLLRKPGGGRLAAREVLLNTAAVASLIADGKTAQVPMAIEEGRKIGMISLNESLAALVKNSSVDVREAYRCAGDRQGLLALLKLHGVDTTLFERHA
jgi:twitching motility protein PilT